MTENTQAKPAQQFQRKTIMIKKGLQYRYMALIFFSVFIAFIIAGLDILWTVSKVVGEHPMMIPLLDELSSTVPLFAIKLVMFMVIVLIVSAVISHRMAGPIFKFEKSCATVAGGDLTHRVYLRKGDQLTDLQDQFNNMVKAVHETTRALDEFSKEASLAHPDLGPKAEALSKKILEIMPNYKI
ncbi:MAG: methyl-accepting chemotaxis protein [Elusimicrobia bacterium]|nr:methyl-accepting chemotaxis protein [Elusimicrobiota bacterium]